MLLFLLFVFLLWFGCAVLLFVRVFLRVFFVLLVRWVDGYIVLAWRVLAGLFFLGFVFFLA